jgi:hypothetical protein
MNLIQYFDKYPGTMFFWWNDRLFVNRPDLGGVIEIGDGFTRFISRTWYE